MKKIILALIISFPALAGNSAIIPAWKTGSDYQKTTTQITVSNITDRTIQFQIKFYSQDGAVYDDKINYKNVSAGTLGAHKTALIELTPSQTDWGYGVITHRGDAGLVAHGRIRTTGLRTHAIESVTINNGLPF
ncbi:hypothetical protein [Vibrio quintilis]|uniref:Uncharacterized protein n=1 Tax=Vibrio quintilis TaxID=1117707 RepID=A0A1M7YYW7_9VIBR|nr:hypothetical protein [Vibrio quintilis]SHO57879.1 hypothetical protein VQ7734_03649 [Vibrio quintilis]